MLALLLIANVVIRPRAVSKTAIRVPLASTMRKIARDPAAWLVYGGIFGTYISCFIPLFYVVSYAQRYSTNAAVANYSLSIINALAFFSRIGSGLVADRFGTFNTAIPLSFLVGVLTFAMIGATSTPALVVFLVLFGIAQGGWISVSASVFMILANDVSEIGCVVLFFFPYLPRETDSVSTALRADSAPASASSSSLLRRSSARPSPVRSSPRQAAATSRRSASAAAWRWLAPCCSSLRGACRSGGRARPSFKPITFPLDLPRPPLEVVPFALLSHYRIILALYPHLTMSSLRLPSASPFGDEQVPAGDVAFGLLHDPRTLAMAQSAAEEEQNAAGLAARSVAAAQTACVLHPPARLRFDVG